MLGNQSHDEFIKSKTTFDGDCILYGSPQGTRCRSNISACGEDLPQLIILLLVDPSVRHSLFGLISFFTTMAVATHKVYKMISFYVFAILEKKSKSNTCLLAFSVVFFVMFVCSALLFFVVSIGAFFFL